MGKLLPYSGPFERPELLHLLRRSLFGVSQDDLKAFQGKTLQEALDVIVPKTPTMPSPPVRAYFNNADPALDTLEKYENPAGSGNFSYAVEWGKTWVDTPIPANVIGNPNNNRRLSLKNWWTGLMIHQDRNVYEKMIQFYQTVLVTEDSVVENSNSSFATHKLYRKYAFGNYKQLIKEISLDPGMLRYLNGNLNTKTAPDENYARELQELFTVGKGPGSGYTEDDVKAAAKLLTGWTIITRENNQNILPKKGFNKNNHDTGVKQFSAFYNNKIIQTDMSITNKDTFETVEERRAYEELIQMIEMIFSTEEVSRYICRRLWNFFVYYEITPEIESEVIEPLAEIFRQYQDDPDQMHYVVKALLGSDYFFKPEHRGCMIKSAIDFHVGIFRTLKYPLPDASMLEAQYYMWNRVHTFNVNAGQDVNDPPNVAGWPAYYQAPSFYEMWIDTSTYPGRKAGYETFARSSFSLNKTTTYGGTSSPSYGFTVKYNWVDFVKRFDNPSDPVALIQDAVELMLGAPVTQGVKDQLKTNYLLLGQASDHYWTDAWDTYIANPNTTDPEGRRVPTMLQDLFIYLMSSAEFHLC